MNSTLSSVTDFSHGKSLSLTSDSSVRRESFLAAASESSSGLEMKSGSESTDSSLAAKDTLLSLSVIVNDWPFGRGFHAIRYGNESRHGEIVLERCPVELSFSSVL